jgi:hypothetical protein
MAPLISWFQQLNVQIALIIGRPGGAGATWPARLRTDWLSGNAPRVRRFDPASLSHITYHYKTRRAGEAGLEQAHQGVLPNLRSLRLSVCSRPSAPGRLGHQLEEDAAGLSRVRPALTQQDAAAADQGEPAQRPTQRDLTERDLGAALCERFCTLMISRFHVSTVKPKEPHLQQSA